MSSYRCCIRLFICMCPTSRPTALKSCVPSVGCHHQSLMPLSVVTLSGKPFWTASKRTATSRLVSLLEWYASEEVGHADNTRLKLKANTSKYATHSSFYYSVDQCVSLIYFCQMQGELEGSARHKELKRSAENFFKLSVVSESRCYMHMWGNTAYNLRHCSAPAWMRLLCLLSQCPVPRWGGSAAAAQLQSIQPGGAEESRVTAPPRGQWVKIYPWIDCCPILVGETV